MKVQHQRCKRSTQKIVLKRFFFFFARETSWRPPWSEKHRYNGQRRNDPKTESSLDSPNTRTRLNMCYTSKKKKIVVVDPICPADLKKCSAHITVLFLCILAHTSSQISPKLEKTRRRQGHWITARRRWTSRLSSLLFAALFWYESMEKFTRVGHDHAVLGTSSQRGPWLQPAAWPELRRCSAQRPCTISRGSSRTRGRSLWWPPHKKRWLKS